MVLKGTRHGNSSRAGGWLLGLDFYGPAAKAGIFPLETTMARASTTAAVATAGAPFVDASARIVAVLFIDFQFPFRETEDDSCRGARLSVDLRPLLSTPG